MVSVLQLLVLALVEVRHLENVYVGDLVQRCKPLVLLFEVWMVWEKVVEFHSGSFR